MIRFAPFLMALAVAFWLTSCESDSKSSQSGETENTSVSTTQGGYAAPQPLPADDPEALAFAQEYWVFEYYVTDDPEARRFNRGRWYQFHMDGTFTGGHWTAQTEQGSWAIVRNYDRDVVLVDAQTKKPIDPKAYDLHLIIDSNNDAHDGDFVVNFSGSQYEASWTGARGSQFEGLPIKAIRLSDRPTKAQFGLE